MPCIPARGGRFSPIARPEIPLIRGARSAQLDRVGPVLTNQLIVQFLAAAHQQKVLISELWVELNHVRDIESSGRVNEVDVVSRSRRRRNLCQMPADDRVDLQHLKRHDDEQTEDCGGACKGGEALTCANRLSRVSGRICGASAVDCAGRQDWNDSPGRVKIPVAPAMALVELDEAVAGKGQQRGLRQKTYSAIAAAAQPAEGGKQEQAGHGPYPQFHEGRDSHFEHGAIRPSECPAEALELR